MTPQPSQALPFLSSFLALPALDGLPPQPECAGLSQATTLHMLSGARSAARKKSAKSVSFHIEGNVAGRAGEVSPLSRNGLVPMTGMSVIVTRNTV